MILDKKDIILSKQRGTIILKIDRHIDVNVNQSNNLQLIFELENTEDFTVNIKVSESSNINAFFVTKNNSNKISINSELNKSNLNFHTLIVGEKNKGMKTIINKLGNNSSIDFYSLNIGYGNFNYELNLENISENENCHSNAIMKSVLYDTSSLKIKGHPHIKKNANWSSAHLDQKSLLLSPKCKINFQPMLTTYSSNIKSSHKSSLVNFDKEDEFYLNSRGISKIKMKYLLQKNIVDEFINSFNNKNIEQYLKNNPLFLNSY